MKILKVIFFPFSALFKYIKRQIIKSNLRRVTIEAIDSLDGYDFEKLVHKIFYAYGYNVTLTKKSGDKGVDLVAKRFKKKIVIQAKMYYNNNVGNSAIQQIHTAREYFGACTAVAFTNSFFTKSAKDMANKLNIVLIDRPKLKSILLHGQLRKYITTTNNN